MKKLLSIVLSMVMLIATLGAIPTSAEIEFINHNSFYDSSSNLAYQIIDGVYYELEPDDCDDSYYGSVVGFLPPKDSKKVEILEDVYFQGERIEIYDVGIYKQRIFANYNSSIEEIVIGNISSISGINFIPSLKKVTIGETVYSISDCFYGCKNLETIDGNPAFKVEDGAVYKQIDNVKRLVSILDTEVESFEIKNGTTYVDSPFGTYRNIAIKSLSVNENLDYFKPGKMPKLNTITFSENVNRIKKIDLNGVRNLKKLDLSNIKVNTFSAKGVWHMKSIAFGKVNKLIKNSFTGCKKIEKIEFKENVPKIYKDAFKNKREGIEFYVNSKADAKILKKQLKRSGAKNPKIYIGEKLYK